MDYTQSANMCEEIQFLMVPFGRQVHVVWGLPRRPRELSLFVSHDLSAKSYMWGTNCKHSAELSRAILTFALNHLDACGGCGIVDDNLKGNETPSKTQINAFLHDVVAVHSKDSTWEITLEEVREWLEKNPV